MRYDADTRKRISEDAAGKVVKSLEWVEHGGGYWVMTFVDGSEACFRFMAEIRG